MAAMPDDEAPRPKAGHLIGQDLSVLSVHELAERIELLRQEILRLEAAMSSKTAQRDAAEQVFGRR